MGADRLGILRLAHDETPVARGGSCGPKVREVEGEHGELVALGDRHHGGVDEAQVETGVLRVDLHRSPHEPGCEKGERVLTGGQRAEKQACGLGADPRSDEVVDLDRDGIGDDEIPPESPDERRRQGVRAVAPVDRGDDRPRVRDDSQPLSASLRRYSSTRSPRSAGPSPEAT